MPPILLKETNPESGKAFFSSGGCRSCLCLFPLRKSTLTCLLFPGTVQLNHHKVRLAGGGDGVGYAGPQTWLWLQAPFFISWVAWGLEIAPTVISVLSTELRLKEWELPMFMKLLTYWKTAGSRHQEARPKIQARCYWGSHCSSGEWEQFLEVGRVCSAYGLRVGVCPGGQAGGMA